MTAPHKSRLRRCGARSSPARRLAGATVAIGLLATSCSMFDGDTAAPKVTGAGLGPRPVESGLPAKVKPTRGGQLVYGLEVETAGGFCLPESQLAASGIEIVRAVLMINTEEGSLTERATRVAIAQAIDRKELNELANKGFSSVADGPFAPEVLGALDDPGFPDHDLKAAKEAVAAMKAAGQDTELSLLTSTGPAAVRTAVIEKRMLEEAGFSIRLEAESESDLITRVIGGDYELVAFRNQPGEDPDSNFHWWNGGGNPVNFGRFDDPVINANLATGRSSADRDTRRQAYEAINRQFAKEVYNVYLWYSPWAVAEAADVHGILGPDLPDGSGPPPGRLVTGHALHGIWIDRN